MVVQSPQPVQQPKPLDLASRTFEDRRFQLAWIIFLSLFFILVSWRIRNFLLVCWVYGKDAYFNRGIRVLPGKPIRFSNGERAPQIPDIVTGFGMFFGTVGGLSAALFFALRLYERHFGGPGSRPRS